MLPCPPRCHRKPPKLYLPRASHTSHLALQEKTCKYCNYNTLETFMQLFDVCFFIIHPVAFSWDHFSHIMHLILVSASFPMLADVWEKISRHQHVVQMFCHTTKHCLSMECIFYLGDLPDCLQYYAGKLRAHLWGQINSVPLIDSQGSCKIYGFPGFLKIYGFPRFLTDTDVMESFTLIQWNEPCIFTQAINYLLNAWCGVPIWDCLFIEPPVINALWGFSSQKPLMMHKGIGT